MVYGLSVSHTGVADEGELIRLTGDLDHVTLPTFERKAVTLVGSGATRVVLDLSAVGFIDSSGLSGIIELFHRLKLSGGRLGVICPDGGPRRIFERTGVGALLGISRTRDEAVASLRA